MVSTRNGYTKPNRIRRFAIPQPKRLPMGELGTPERFQMVTSRRARHTEYVPELRGEQGQENLREFVLTNPQCTAAHDAIILPLATASWYFRPASDDPQDVELAEMVQEQLDGMHRRTARQWIREALSTRLIHGHSTWEPVYEGGRLMDLAPRPPETLREILQDEHGRVIGVLQRNGVELLIEEGRCLHFIRQQRGADGRGWSAFRGAWRPGKYGEQVEQIANIAAEKNSMGIPVARFAESATADEMQDFMETISKLHANELAGLGLPAYVTEFDIKAVSGSTFPVLELLKRYDQQILRALGVEYLAIGLTDTGSYAARTDASSEITSKLVAEASSFRETVNCDLVPWLVLAATGDPNVPKERHPTLEHDGIDVSDFASVGTFVQMMASIGAITLTPEDEIWLRGLANLPARELEDMKEEDEEEDETPPPPPPPPPADDDPEEDPEGDAPEDDAEPEEDEEVDEPVAMSRKEGSGCCTHVGPTFRLQDAQARPFEARRELTVPEQRVAFVALASALDTAIEDAASTVGDLRGQWIDYLVGVAEDLLTDPQATLDDLEDIEIPEELTAPAAKAIEAELLRLYAEGRASVIEETERGADVPSGATELRAAIRSGTIYAALERPDPLDDAGVRDMLGESGRLSVRSIVGALIGTFAKAVRDVLGLPGGTDDQLEAIRERMADLSSSSIEDEVRQASTEALNMGRQASLEAMSDEFTEFQLSELLDANTCGPCLELDGETYPSMEAVIAADRYPPQSVCEGRARCRGIVVGTLASEVSREG